MISIELNNVVEYRGNAWRVSSILSKSDNILIERLKCPDHIERRYVKTDQVKFLHHDYEKYLILELIQVNSVVKLENTLYKVVGRQNDKIVVENGGGSSFVTYVGEVEFIHSNYQAYALLPNNSEATREYSRRLTAQATKTCDLANQLAISLKIFEEMNSNIPKSQDIQVVWQTSDGKLASEQLLEAISSFEIALNEYQEIRV